MDKLEARRTMYCMEDYCKKDFILDTYSTKYTSIPEYYMLSDKSA